MNDPMSVECPICETVELVRREEEAARRYLENVERLIDAFQPDSQVDCVSLAPKEVYLECPACGFEVQEKV